MTHPICTQANDFSYLQQLWNLLLDPQLDMGSKLEQVFEDETANFDLDYAFLTRIDPETETLHIEVIHGADDVIQRGESCPLSQTYCRETIADPEGTVCINDAAAEGWDDDLAYENTCFESYVGTTVTVEGDLYGTLCFAGTNPRDEPYTDREISLVEMLGEWVTFELEQWSGPPTHDTISQNLDDRDVPLSPQIDEMMDVLGKRPRRYILLKLLDTAAEENIDVFEDVTDAEEARVQLRHVHLPKLEQFEYVDWDRDTGRVSKGPKFSDVEPLLRLLKDYTDEFAES